MDSPGFKREGFWSRVSTPGLFACRFFCLLLILAPFFLPGRNVYIDFEHISVEQGLSQSTVRCIFQDSKGFLWFGTDDGLNRYDGYNFDVFRPVPGDPRSLSSSSIYAIYEDRQGTLWIGTLSGGLNRFDPERETFTRYLHDPDDPGSLSSNHVSAILEDREGKLWIGTYRDGLNRFDPKSETFTRYRANARVAGALSGNKVRGLCLSESGTLWVATFDGGLNRLDTTSGMFSRYRHLGEGPDGLIDDQLMALLPGDGSELWMATYRGALKRFDPATGTFVHFNPTTGQNGGPGNIEISTIRRDPRGFFWIGTSGGLVRFDPGTGTSVGFRNDPSNPRSLNNNDVRSVFIDRSGVLWVGTAVGGINKFNRDKWKFNHYHNIANVPDSLSNDNVVSIYEDRAGEIWIGTFGGLNKFNARNGTFTHYRHDANVPHSLSNDRVMFTYEDGDGVFWVGTLGGLNILHRKTGRFTRYRINDTDLNTAGDRMTAMVEDRGGYLWVGTTEGLRRLTPNRKDFIPFTVDNRGLTDNVVTCIQIDRSGTLWVGTLKGLNRLDPGSDQFIHYRAGEADAGGIPHGGLAHDRINYIYEDRGGLIWLGTNGGLIFYNRHTDRFTHYGIENGLPANMVYGILEDDRNQLWVSNSNRLSRFDPRTVSFKNYGPWDGLQGREFMYGACLSSRNGDLFFGGVNGFNVFHPDRIADDPYPPPIAITDLKIFNQPVVAGDQVEGVRVIDRHISAVDTVQLSHKHSSFSFHYAALHYGAPEMNRFAYRMEGLENHWNHVGNRRFAAYSHLPPGNYVFRVKGCNADGVWNEDGVSIRVVIGAPPWRSWWAYTLYILLFLAVVAGYALSQKRKLAHERALNERLRQVDRLKDEFLASTSHEFLTPLNGIIGIAESLKKGATGPLRPETNANLDMVALCGKRLSSLVGDMLDYSRLKEKDLALKLGPVDMKSLTDVVLRLSVHLATGKSLELKNDITGDIPLVYGDENRLQQIMHNLIGNAVKFTESGFVSVSALCSRDNGQDMVTVKVADTGIGIPSDKFDDIFKSFEQVAGGGDRQYGGTGLGLSITRQLVELHGGTICVESDVDKGSIFCFSIPCHAPRGAVAEKGSLCTGEPVVYTPPPPGYETFGVPAPMTSGAPGNKGRILVVDDEIINLQVLVNHLTLNNYSVTTAMSGAEALELLAEPNPVPDIILLDVMMPRMSGYEVCRRVRRHYPANRLPIIMLTAKNMLAGLVEGLNSGANDYITKPFSSEELLERINVHLQLLKANRELKEANRKLEDYNLTLEQKVEARTRALDEKNKMITDSIVFAQRIQQSILPMEEKIRKGLPEFFILHRPKDIVSGDFYWFEQVGDIVFAAVVDCTGHGVPGALMSMIGSTILNKLVQEQGIRDAALILKNLNRDVKTALKHKDARHIDTAGMDVCLCRIEKIRPIDGTPEVKVTFCGAHLPLYIARGKGKNRRITGTRVLEIKGNRESIGDSPTGRRLKTDAPRTFSQKEFILSAGDMIYLTTDGFAHQNNRSDKKYGKKRLKQLMDDIVDLDMEKQHGILTVELETFMEGEEQRDDITIFGIRL